MPTHLLLGCVNDDERDVQLRGITGVVKRRYECILPLLAQRELRKPSLCERVFRS